MIDPVSLAFLISCSQPTEIALYLYIVTYFADFSSIQITI